VQTDFKFVIGYSSVSHMGFVLLGLMTASAVGLSGAALQMFSHGIIAGLLFAVVGRMVYDRTHTRDLTKLEQMDLRKWLPGAAVIFTLAGFASMGFPGFSGFVAELQVLIGAWSSQAGCALLAGCGILVGVAFMLRAMHKAFFAEPAEDHGAGGHRLPGLSVPEKIGGALLLVISVAVGLYPSVLLDLIRTSIGSPLFDGLRKGGAF